MSSLYDFVHHKMGEDPGCQNLHSHIPGPIPDTDEPVPRASGSIEASAKANAARRKGALKGEMYYSQWEAKDTLEGRPEDAATVRGKVLEKEIFPLG